MRLDYGSLKLHQKGRQYYPNKDYYQLSTHIAARPFPCLIDMLRQYRAEQAFLRVRANPPSAVFRKELLASTTRRSAALPDARATQWPSFASQLRTTQLRRPQLRSDDAMAINCAALEVWPWTFGFRTIWLVNKSAGQPQSLIGSIVIDPEAVLESFRISESGPVQAGPDPTCPTPPRSTHGQCTTMIRILGP